MSEPWLAAIITIAGGVIVYALGHLSVALFVEPIHRLRSLIGEIADSLIFYANVYSNPELNIGTIELYDKASETLRRHASQLKARAYAIPWYHLWALMRLVRKKTEIEEASAELIGLSNSVHGGPGITGLENDKKRRIIEKLLGIRTGKKQNEKEKHPLNSYALAQGILLFFFALILLGLQDSTIVLFFDYELTLPIWIYRALGIIALTASIAFMIAIPWKQLGVKLKNFLEQRPISRWQAFIKWLYWVVFWIVYIAGWLQGLSNIPGGEFTFQVVFWIGFIWFCVIGIMVLRPAIVWFKNLLFRKHKV